MRGLSLPQQLWLWLCRCLLARRPPAVRSQARASRPNSVSSIRTQDRAQRPLRGARTIRAALRLSNGTYALEYTGRIAKNVIISGLYVTDGRTITLKNRTGACSSERPGGCGFLSCPKPGRDSFNLTGQSLTFTKLQDANPNCERPVVLSGKFRRVR